MDKVEVIEQHQKVAVQVTEPPKRLVQVGEGKRLAVQMNPTITGAPLPIEVVNSLGQPIADQDTEDPLIHSVGDIALPWALWDEAGPDVNAPINTGISSSPIVPAAGQLNIIAPSAGIQHTDGSAFETIRPGDANQMPGIRVRQEGNPDDLANVGTQEVYDPETDLFEILLPAAASGPSLSKAADLTPVDAYIKGIGVSSIQIQPSDRCTLDGRIQRLGAFVPGESWAIIGSKFQGPTELGWTLFYDHNDGRVKFFLRESATTHRWVWFNIGSWPVGPVSHWAFTYSPIDAECIFTLNRISYPRDYTWDSTVGTYAHTAPLAINVQLNPDLSVGSFAPPRVCKFGTMNHWPFGCTLAQLQEIYDRSIDGYAGLSIGTASDRWIASDTEMDSPENRINNEEGTYDLDVINGDINQPRI